MRSGSAQRINNEDFADQSVYRGADRTEKQQRVSTQSSVSQGDSKASSGYKRSVKGKKAEKKRPGVLKTAVVLAFTVVFALLAVQMLEQERILRRQKERIADLQRQYDSLLTQIDDINREVELAGSSSYIEHYLREKLGMIKKGETLYKIVPDESSAP